MIKFDDSVELSEAIDKINAHIEQEKENHPSTAYVSVTDVPEGKAESLIAEFKRGGFFVSERTNVGRVVLIWNDSVLDGFKRSGYIFTEGE